LEARVRTDKTWLDSEASGVGTQIQMQQAVLLELRSGVTILQAQDNQIMEEANSIFEEFRNELGPLNQRISLNAARILLVSGTSIGTQKALKELNKRIDDVKKVLLSITTSLKEVQSRKDSR